MKFANPVTGIGDHQLPNRRGIVLEINRLTPFIGVLGGEIPRRELTEKIAVWAEMVVDDVENYRETQPMGAIDEPAQIIGRAIEMAGREEVDTVVSPTPASGKFGNRHRFDRCDP